MPEDAIYVGRPSLWGNPWTPKEAWCGGTKAERAAWAVAKYREELTHWGLLTDFDYVVSDRRWGEIEQAARASGARNMGEYAAIVLRGHDLVCWCPLEDENGNRVPCHADVLLDVIDGDKLRERR
jgi:hypothetical protein